uniref:MORN repeat-containing protein 4 n=1 Tax=Euplotes harpa TaxID=151035 RepID=A0A7S3N2M1_9SPIT|mmetsp:Transcript_13837/g.16053  ORF Transcript_13837/g.16053 Transcript_13837/m.16053 type:complete len:106 (+) Transcript_13837:447-764(+)|eukprot:CAMPEP_0168325222 /NCGR_PEP_ID=MMETSP0213-20121227/4566_1 /TAXON_ID=151035 /ORGANISM="Euplotes harpa, Strain FSP1.4" /LENGTH=105 /DNA_ID=CAMNT_0008327679 /DNA_START=550 /DNA_END=867 /DNA_ORIENTATION=+
MSFTADGSKYTGQFIKDSNIKDGIGYMIFPDGSIFEGTFKDDLPVKGRHITAHGDVFSGRMVISRQDPEELKQKESYTDIDDDSEISYKSWDVGTNSNYSDTFHR